MWRTVTGESSGASATAAPGGELTSGGLHAHESPLLGLLSAVSRPAASFLQRYLPGRAAVKRDFMEQDGEFLRQFDDILPPQQLHSFTLFNLTELGLQSPGDTSLTSARTVVSQVLVPHPRSVSRTWWGSLWGNDDDEKARSLSAGLLFVQERGESAGAARDKGAFTTNSSVPQLKIIQNQSLGSDITVLTPDQDNGYSSLEEEQLLVAKAQLQGALPGMARAEESAQEPESEEHLQEEEEDDEDVSVLKCDNKAIAFIMGCPCSDDSQSESEEEDSEDEDDDGFDSDCSSDVSDSDDDEDEFDSETERLWSTLCQNNDPYNPRNFTAKIASAPKPIPKPEPSEVQSSPGSSVSSVSSSCGSSSSWDEASETEEQENLRLLGAFCSSDPYSPLNFQAQIRTKKPEPRPEPRPEEEQRVRKVSEPSKSDQSSARTTSEKKVRFCDEVQFFFVGSEEDRRGQWEEFARDRARFQRRCSEVEQHIGFCLQQEHRERVYHRVCASYGQSEAEERPSSQSEPPRVQTGQRRVPAANQRRRKNK